jgi:hypothetical protein
MSTEAIAQDMGVDPAWVQSLVSMVEGADTSEANNHKPEETEA